jgi:sec-independent protein translocase protein TatB
MNFGFSGEMVFLFFLALILFGPKKLPEIGRQIGRFMNEFRRASNEFRSQIETEINSLQTDIKPQILPPEKAPLGSLASRIFNPPAAEKVQEAEAKPAAEPAAETAATTTPVSKVAPDV